MIGPHFHDTQGARETKMPLPRRPSDQAQLAKLVVDMATGEVPNDKEQVLAAFSEQEQPTGRAKSAKARAASQTAGAPGRNSASTLLIGTLECRVVIDHNRIACVEAISSPIIKHYRRGRNATVSEVKPAVRLFREADPAVSYQI